jgi:hypothetical protein
LRPFRNALEVIMAKQSNEADPDIEDRGSAPENIAAEIDASATADGAAAAEDGEPKDTVTEARTQQGLSREEVEAFGLDPFVYGYSTKAD